MIARIPAVRAERARRVVWGLVLRAVVMDVSVLERSVDMVAIIGFTDGRGRSVNEFRRGCLDEK